MNLSSVVCVCLAIVGFQAATSGGPVLVVRDVPPSGIVMARVDLSPYLASGPCAVAAVDGTGASVPCQFVPEGPGDARRGTLVLRLRPAGEQRVNLRVTRAPAVPAPAIAAPIRLRDAEVSFGEGPFPTRFLFARTGKVFDRFEFHDRLHDPKTGGFSLANDHAARPQVVADGALCTVVRVHARYLNGAGEAPPSKPSATYEWFFFHDEPLVYLSAVVRQEQTFVWSELHFVELAFPGTDFGAWAGGSPDRSGTFTGSRRSETFWNWGALVDGPNAIGLIGDTARFYDGHGEYGTYIHGPWESWAGSERRFETWWWVGSGADVAKAVSAAAATLTPRAVAYVTDAGLHERIAAARAAARAGAGPRALEARWRAALAERFERAGEPAAARRALAGGLPKGWSLHRAGDLGVAFDVSKDGVRLASLCDTRLGIDLLPADPAPIFTLQMKQLSTGGATTLRADGGWREATLAPIAGGIALRWVASEKLGGLIVTATARLDQARSAVDWSMRVERGVGYTIERVAFPLVDVAEPGRAGAAFVPRGPGEVQPGVWHRAFSFRGLYPSGWSAMQFTAAYSAGGTGIYVACHDPYGGTKDIVVESDPSRARLRLAFEHPAPNAGREANGFVLSGSGVWKLLRGDWFDAATAYRQWASREARWWPRLGKDGRADTPLWMRELCAWAQTGGAPAEVVDPVKSMQKALGIPIGFHWYNWHQIPFDNDYPHYFPTKPGVADGVADLQRNGVHVMPYINGRLWDTRDRGVEDFEFTRVALPAVTKQPDGKPFTEQYGSKEADGSPVTLGVMCPTTPLWQKTVRDIVLRLMNEVGTHAVYIDQIAAAAPVLCADPTHGHPLGGGHWWTEQGYWKLLEALRAAMPKDRMITTECNGEPYIRFFDGYLTWHWQFDGQVPAFPAIYGGAIQMFGRNYAGGPTRALATRMKAAQQLVFGEQIGWFDPRMVSDPEFGDFLRRAIGMRHALRRYFFAGEMARPPALRGDVPTVRADWQWYGETWVTTSSVLTGAWRLPRERRAAAIFANVSDKPVRAEWPVSMRSIAGAAGPARLVRLGPDGSPAGPAAPVRPSTAVTLELAPGEIAAWELRW